MSADPNEMLITLKSIEKKLDQLLEEKGLKPALNAEEITIKDFKKISNEILKGFSEPSDLTKSIKTLINALNQEQRKRIYKEKSNQAKLNLLEIKNKINQDRISQDWLESFERLIDSIDSFKENILERLKLLENQQEQMQTILERILNNE